MADTLPEILEPVYETEEQRAAVKKAVQVPQDRLSTQEDNDK